MSAERVFLVVWIVGVLLTWPPLLAWAIRSRRDAGFPLVPRAPADAVYVDRRASGTQRGKWLPASNCLIVAVTASELIVTLKFPFLLIAPVPIAGFAHRAPLSVVSAEPHRDWSGSNVRVTIGGHRPAVLRLRVRESEGLLAALNPLSSLH